MAAQPDSLNQLKRRRLISALLTLPVALLGIGSRRLAAHLPHVVSAYAGDALWATLVFLLVVFLWPHLARRQAAFVALLFSLLVEVSQLYHAPWIDAIRATTLGGLVLGFGFLWSDLLCYAVGVAIGVILDVAINRAAAPAGLCSRPSR